MLQELLRIKFAVKTFVFENHKIRTSCFSFKIIHKPVPDREKNITFIDDYASLSEIKIKPLLFK